MNEQRLFFAVDHVSFQLRGVVRHVVNRVHPKLLSAAAENFGKYFTNRM